MNEELESLYKNRTWKLMKPQKGHKVISCKWVSKKKDPLELKQLIAKHA